jgi:diaminohydroxyphosphoribosylaminopyrimidine deaminase / 5-amino-6-(5-phosphoribosylamino)uracil reductase
VVAVTVDGDAGWMARAVALAERGRGTTSPNPMVGAVLVSDGRVVGEGFHRAAGEPHAEVTALAAAGPLAAGATCYVTLEPCAHQGRTPPCADALLQAGVTRVVAALSDPDQRVDGAGLARLRAAGVVVTVGVGAELAAEQNAAYLTHRRLGRPRITLKAAASLDGKVAAPDGSSQWITGTAARADAHRLRAEADAVAVGAGTARTDDPRLTARLHRPTGAPPWNPADRGTPRGSPEPPRPDPSGDVGRQPLRVLVDAAGRVGADGHLFDAGAPTLVATTTAADATAVDAWKRAGAEVLVCPEAAWGDGGRGVDLAALAAALGRRGVLELLVEGGPRLQASFWAAGLADRLVWYLAPLVIGGDGAPGLLRGGGAPTLTAAKPLRIASVERLGADLRVVAYPRSTGGAASALIDRGTPGGSPGPPRPDPPGPGQAAASAAQEGS